MKNLKYALVWASVLLNLTFAAIFLEGTDPVDFPSKGTLKDKSVYWTTLCENAHDPQTRRICRIKAEYYRDLHNREVSASLERSLTSLGGSPLADEYFKSAYNALKI